MDIVKWLRASKQGFSNLAEDRKLHRSAVIRGSLDDRARQMIAYAIAA